MSEWIYTKDALPPERVRVAVAWQRPGGDVMTSCGRRIPSGQTNWEDESLLLSNAYACIECPEPPLPPSLEYSIAKMFSLRASPKTEEEWSDVIAFIDADRARRASAETWWLAD